jgi:hypothetical protein
MPRNNLAGTKRGKSRTARYYQNNAKAREHNKLMNTKRNATPMRKKYRALLERINYANGTSGNHDGIDNAHVSKGKTRPQKQSKNRADKKRQYFFTKKKKK